MITKMFNMMLIMVITMSFASFSQGPDNGKKNLDKFIKMLEKKFERVEPIVEKANKPEATKAFNEAKVKFDEGKALKDTDPKAARKKLVESSKLLAKALSIAKHNGDIEKQFLEKAIKKVEKKIERVTAKAANNPEALQLLTEATSLIGEAKDFLAQDKLKEAWEKLREANKKVSEAMKLVHQNNHAEKILKHVKAKLEHAKKVIDANPTHPKIADATAKHTEAQAMYDSAVAKKAAGDEKGAILDAQKARALAMEVCKILK